MKKIIIRGYIRAFTETEALVDDEFDITDGEQVQVAWEEQRNLQADMVELLEASLDAEFYDEPAFVAGDRVEFIESVLSVDGKPAQWKVTDRFGNDAGDDVFVLRPLFGDPTWSAITAKAEEIRHVQKFATD